MQHKLNRNHSANGVNLNAVWDSNRIDPRDERRVICIYANPDFDNGFFLIETENVIERRYVESHAEWKPYGNTYLKCERSMPSECTFG